MTLQRWLVLGTLVSLSSLVACVSGEEYPVGPLDTGSPDTGKDDTAVPPDTGAPPVDTGTDTGKTDTSVDTGKADTSVDTGTVDTSVDTGAVDTGAVDTGAVDTGTLDTGAVDTSVDTGAIDTGTVDSGTLDTGAIDSGAVDTGSTDTGKTDTGPLTDLTTGKTCTSDLTCDVTGLGVNVCSNGIFTKGALYPSPVCIGLSCDLGLDPTKIVYCDGSRGVCLDDGASGLCLPACTFDGSSGAAPVGCVGKDACVPYGWGSDTTGVSGVGYCFGGCKTTADCPLFDKCQVEDGLCFTTLTTYTKTVGSACTNLDTAKCNCLYATATNKGYCSQFCKYGDVGACPTGYTCDPMLPKTDKTTGATLFTKAPLGMSAYCLKNCLLDSDCTNGYCLEMAGTGQKTCQVGTK